MQDFAEPTQLQPLQLAPSPLEQLELAAPPKKATPTARIAAIEPQVEAIVRWVHDAQRAIDGIRQMGGDRDSLISQRLGSLEARLRQCDQEVGVLKIDLDRKAEAIQITSVCDRLDALEAALPTLATWDKVNAGYAKCVFWCVAPVLMIVGVVSCQPRNPAPAIAPQVAPSPAIAPEVAPSPSLIRRSKK